MANGAEFRLCPPQLSAESGGGAQGKAMGMWGVGTIDAG